MLRAISLERSAHALFAYAMRSALSPMLSAPCPMRYHIPANALLFTALAGIVAAPLLKTPQRVMKFAHKNE